MKRRGSLRSRRWSLVAAAAAVGWAGCSPSQEFMSLGTGGTGGIYYPLGGAIAARLSLMDPGRQYTAEVSGGAVENVNRLRERQTDLAFATGNTVHEAATGGQDYDEAVVDLRVLAPLYANVAHVVVPRGSRARSVADLEGGLVSVGASGSGTEQMSRQILEAYGLSYDDVRPRYLSFNESATALKDGAIDAAILSVGFPAAAVLEATTTGGARILPMEAERVRSLRERYPYYVVDEIPVGAYPGVDEAVPTAGILNWVVGMSDVPDDVVGHLVDLLTLERERLAQVHDMAGQIDMESLRDAPIELHRVTRAWADAHLGSGSR